MCLHPRGITTGAPPHNQQLHRHPGTTAATPPPTPAAQVLSRLHGSALIFMGPRDTKYDPSSIPSLPNYNSSPNCNQNVHIFDTYLTNSTLANIHATLKPSMLEPPCTGLESSPFTAHLEQHDEADPAIHHLCTAMSLKNPSTSTPSHTMLPTHLSAARCPPSTVPSQALVTDSQLPLMQSRRFSFCYMEAKTIHDTKSKPGSDSSAASFRVCSGHSASFFLLSCTYMHPTPNRKHATWTHT